MVIIRKKGKLKVKNMSDLGQVFATQNANKLFVVLKKQDSL